jgi:hypothetical protein
LVEQKPYNVGMIDSDQHESFGFGFFNELKTKKNHQPDCSKLQKGQLDLPTLTW